VHTSGALNLVVEALDHYYFLYVERCVLQENSAGNGYDRDRLGVVGDYCILGEDILLSLSSEHRHISAEEICEGEAGTAGAFVIKPGQLDERRLPSAAASVPSCHGRGGEWHPVSLPFPQRHRCLTGAGGAAFGELAAQAGVARRIE
jgi:N-methylhydantoinase B/oxoprolinase/acetone carboxylase alpha subunit